jgi:DNA-binding transcriptional regulator YhcF (GntR family)
MKSVLVSKLGSFTAVPNAFIECQNISHEAFRIFVVLLSYTNSTTKDSIAFPSYETIKTRTCVKSYSTIAKALRELESAGWIERKKRFGQSTIYTITAPEQPDSSTSDVELKDDAVLHAAKHSPTRCEAQSYTPSQTNKINLTRSTQQDLDAANAASGARVKKDVLDLTFERVAHLNKPLAVIEKWNAPAHITDMCVAFAEIFEITVSKTDKGKWIAGALRLHEIGTTREDLRVVKSQIKNEKNLVITHPNAVYEFVKRIASTRRQDDSPKPTYIPVYN